MRYVALALRGPLSTASAFEVLVSAQSRAFLAACGNAGRTALLDA